MKKSHLSFVGSLALFAGLIYCGAASTAHGSPAAEVSKAFKIASANSHDPTSTKPFLQAWRAVISGADESTVREYVAEAIRLRPNMCADIVESTLSTLIAPKKQQLSRRDLSIVRETIDGALEARAACAASVVSAALRAQPFARDQIVAAALQAAPGEKEAIAEAASRYHTLSWISLARAGYDEKVIVYDTLNAANIDTRVANVISPEKEPN
jgi:hypothetical protein